MSDAAIRFLGVDKQYKRGAEVITVLDALDFEVASGAYVSLMGPSGSGKSTLLHLMAGLDQADAGKVIVENRELTSMGETALAGFRSECVGFIFQMYNLIPVLTALENVALPLLLTDLGRKERRERARTALRVVGLEDRLDHFPRQLSGGQEQRVAIARAIVTDPAIILADEPTGDLDRKSATEILDLFGRLHADFNKTIVTVTHDPLAAERASLRYRLDKGKLST